MHSEEKMLWPKIFSPDHSLGLSDTGTLTYLTSVLEKHDFGNGVPGTGHITCEETEAEGTAKANALMNPPPRLRHRWDQAGRHPDQTQGQLQPQD